MEKKKAELSGRQMVKSDAVISSTGKEGGVVFISGRDVG
jgi:hypothetical protein